jgi:hypothetical protein
MSRKKIFYTFSVAGRTMEARLERRPDWDGFGTIYLDVQPDELAEGEFKETTLSSNIGDQVIERWHMRKCIVTPKPEQVGYLYKGRRRDQVG